MDPVLTSGIYKYEGAGTERSEVPATSSRPEPRFARFRAIQHYLVRAAEAALLGNMGLFWPKPAPFLAKSRLSLLPWFPCIPCIPRIPVFPYSRVFRIQLGNQIEFSSFLPEWQKARNTVNTGNTGNTRNTPEEARRAVLRPIRPYGPYYTSNTRPTALRALVY